MSRSSRPLPFSVRPEDTGPVDAPARERARVLPCGDATPLPAPSAAIILEDELGALEHVTWMAPCDHFAGVHLDLWPLLIREAMTQFHGELISRVGTINVICEQLACLPHRGRWWCVRRIYFERRKG